MAIQTAQLAPLIAPLLALPFIILRHRRQREVHVAWLWFVPALVVFGAVMTLIFQTPVGWALWLGCIAALIVGAGVGFWRGGQRELELSPEGRILSRSSPEALVLIIVIFVLRYAARTAGDAHLLPIDPRALSDLFLAFALGLVVVERAVLARRCLALRRA